MLKKVNRLTSTLFKLFEESKVVHTKNFFIKYTKNLLSDENRIAVVVPKTASASAVMRNRIKRRIREALGHTKLLDSTNQPLLIAIYTKRGALNLSVQEIIEELSCTQVLHNL